MWHGPRISRLDFRTNPDLDLDLGSNFPLFTLRWAFLDIKQHYSKLWMDVHEIFGTRNKRLRFATGSNS